MEIELYKETFEQEVLQSDIPVLVDFLGNMVRSVQDDGLRAVEALGK